jgi:hypothetical protein
MRTCGKSMGKILPIAVILLFMGVAVAPSINASVFKDELVEFDVELCGLGKKHTISLTQQEADDVDLLFTDIEQRLSEVETRDEAEDIFKEVIVELDNYGLLGRLSIKQAQQLIVGSNVQQNLLKGFDKIGRESLDNETANYFCLIVGHLSNIASQNPLARRFYIFLYNLWVIAKEFNKVDIVNLLSQIAGFLGLIQSFSLIYKDLLMPFYFYNALGVGSHSINAGNGEEYWNPAEGWILSLGLDGIKSLDGNLWGDASKYLIEAFFISFYTGIIGFTGIKITTVDYDSYFIGFALMADFSYDRPE